MIYESANLAEAERAGQSAHCGGDALIEFPGAESECRLLPLRETLLIGPTCRETVVSSDRVPQLASSRFIWIGLSEVRPPYRIVRPCTKYSHVVASLRGQGNVLIDGQTVDWRPNQVLISPRGTVHAFEAVQPEPWILAWVFYQDCAGEAFVSGNRTRLIETDCSDFAQVLQLLLKETSGWRDEQTIQSLVALLHTHTQRLVGSTDTDQRLARLWHSVESDLRYPWDIEKLAKKAFLSAEQLRRLCHRYHRKSPMAHVRDLRMHYASGLLRSSACSVENVALQAGFASLYSFSAAFKRWSGVSPARFRNSRP
ncbi:MAG TPA: AraC family transcriptional regulator [Opitutaceae bacterium]|nr:AraC family transcriptional regulator [Opitutaceae bacterium]